MKEREYSSLGSWREWNLLSFLVNLGLTSPGMFWGHSVVLSWLSL